VCSSDLWFLPDFAEMPRVAKSFDLADALTGCSVARYVDFDAAWTAVWSLAVPGDRILVFGSFVTVGAAIDCIQRAETSAA
jgi:dihydrofolate synthase/folylpolyglutamate synthase